MSILNKIIGKKLTHYSGIDDLPVWNWLRINESNDLSFLLLTKREVNTKEHEYLNTIFESIYEQFITAFGVNETMKRAMELRRDIGVLKLEMAISGDLSRQTFIDIKEDELGKLLLETEKQSNITMKAYVDKFMGFHIDEKKVSVKEYYSYIELLKKEAEATQKQKDGR